MATSSSPSPVLDVTVRVGCSLVYEVTGSAMLLLNLQPCRNRNHEVVFQALSLGDNLPAEQFSDSHGNQVSRVQLRPGSNFFRHDAIVRVSSRPDNHDLVDRAPQAAVALPPAVLRYAMPSRYCDSDKLANFAWEKFGTVEHGWARVQAISRWIHDNLEYRYMSGRPDLSAWDVLQRGYGVCRDFAHLAIALNRCFNVPARYVTGHLPDIGWPDPEGHMDFHAYAEVYLGGEWFTTDARFHAPRIGRIKVACGQDAVDGAFSTIFGGATLSYFQVWAYQVARGTVGVGDPLDLTRRLDNQWTVRTDPTG
ncbi:transglutaminase family protein [Oleiharenicola lentus]|jgi:transglutaminase-like putative cysteine protease|uniref:Transglutaminase family protein n=1 Tax=Oleiharenicola lentus TaxID=2508720 RepID=A0A4Q1C4Q9_9BACT|nr:transglutaminase family protein [Oleiharenicola lentus]RXK53249.1 transglutaminase family protein [Oleiharenicola lentus]